MYNIPILPIESKVLSDTMDTSEEVVKLIKYSPQRQQILHTICQNIDNDDDIPELGISTFSRTRWTTTSKCYQRIIDNYAALEEEWNVCLKMKLKADVKSRIIGCQTQMRKFEYFFGLQLSQCIFSHTDNLSKTLQGFLKR